MSPLPNPISFIFSGRSRIRGANPLVWGKKTYSLTRFLPKTAWKWEKWGHTPLAPLWIHQWFSCNFRQKNLPFNSLATPLWGLHTPLWEILDPPCRGIVMPRSHYYAWAPIRQWPLGVSAITKPHTGNRHPGTCHGHFKKARPKRALHYHD